MISCYTLLAVYLSSAGALDVPNLDHSYFLLKRDGEVAGQIRADGVEYTYLVSTAKQFKPHDSGNDVTTVDKCEIKEKTYYGAFNQFKAPLK